MRACCLGLKLGARAFVARGQHGDIVHAATLRYAAGKSPGAILPRPCNVTQPNDRALQAKFFVHCGGIHHTANNTMTLICCSGTPTLLGLQENDYFYNMQLFRTMRLIMQQTSNDWKDNSNFENTQQLRSTSFMASLLY
eukprot:273834-Chlamydomonas_euryale.AAC.4